MGFLLPTATEWIEALLALGFCEVPQMVQGLKIVPKFGRSQRNEFWTKLNLEAMQNS
jgi:hypothetical protein